MSMVVLACNLCANNQLHQRWWELGAVLPASLVLLIEVLVSNSTLSECSKPIRSSLHGLVGVAVIVGLWGSLTAPILGGLAFIAILAARTVLVATLTLRQRGVAQRLTITVVALAICVLIKVPANRSPDELVTVLIGTPFHFDEQSWAFKQLQSEGVDGLAEAEKRLDELRAEDLRARTVVTLELHQQLGGSPARRLAPCARIALKELDETLAPRIARVCNVLK